MNTKLEKNLASKIKKLKNLGMSGVKLSLEDEGSTFEGLRIMSNITKFYLIYNL